MKFYKVKVSTNCQEVYWIRAETADLALEAATEQFTEDTGNDADDYEVLETSDTLPKGECVLEREEEARTMTGVEPEGRYFSKSRLLDASKKGIDWGYNRQIDESIGAVADFDYPVFAAFTHHHKGGEPCEEHIRALVHIQQGKDAEPRALLVDMPKDYWNTLPRRTKK